MIDTSFDGAFNSMLLKIPNREIEYCFLKSLITYFENVYCIEKRLVERTVRLLRKLDINNENVCQHILMSVRSVLETMCSRGIYQKMLNEATLHELMFTILYMSGYEPTSEFIVGVGDGKKYTKYDLCASIHSGQGILIEFEINESSDLALKKIIDKTQL